MSDFNEISWLIAAAEQWRHQAAQQRTPHALLISGLPGVGKRAFAAWVAGQRYEWLDSATEPHTPYDLREHPDLYWLAPPSDKNSIGIEQVRELAGELALTSHAGGGKMAVIEPADTMTHSAANGLLKTLEEPAGDTLLVLLVDRNGALPATIVSRCQRLDIPVPAHELALRWLNQTACFAGSATQPLDGQPRRSILDQSRKASVEPGAGCAPYSSVPLLNRHSRSPQG